MPRVAPRLGRRIEFRWRGESENSSKWDAAAMLRVGGETFAWALSLDKVANKHSHGLRK
jgi:hypothetical protein